MPGHFGILAVAPAGGGGTTGITIARRFGSGVSGTGTGSVANIGGSPNAGDLLVAVVGLSNVTDPTTITAPGGFVSAATAWHAPASGVDPAISIMWKQAAGSEGTGPYAFSIASGTIVQVELICFSKSAGAGWTVAGSDTGVGAVGANETTTGTGLTGATGPTNTNALAVIGAAMQNTISAEAAAGYTMQATAATNRLAAGYQFLTTTSAVSGTVTWTTGRRWAGALVVFDPGA